MTSELLCFVRSSARKNPVSLPSLSAFNFSQVRTRLGQAGATWPSEADMYRVKVQYKVGCVQPCI